MLHVEETVSLLMRRGCHVYTYPLDDLIAFVVIQYTVSISINNQTSTRFQDPANMFLQEFGFNVLILKFVCTYV